MMTQKHTKLSAQSVTVLTMIAKGHTYQQILDQHPELTYPDIFHAAQEALEATETIPSNYQQRLAHIRQTYPRAYEQWTTEEESTLAQLVREGLSQDEIAKRLQRQPTAIRSRMEKLKFAMSKSTREPEPPEAKASLEAEFHEAMLEIYRLAAEHGYYATRFKQLVHNRGGVGAVRWLLTKEDVHEELAMLWELGLLEYSAEAFVLHEHFHPLFSETERQEARRRLDALGYSLK
jgi:DNA-binding CsgD family transcriptional regulator